MTEPLYWLKERILECEFTDLRGQPLHDRVHCRLRSDGSMWYQIVVIGGHLDRNPELLAARFAEYLGYEGHDALTEAEFDADFLERLQKTNGKEITSIVQ